MKRLALLLLSIIFVSAAHPATYQEKEDYYAAMKEAIETNNVESLKALIDSPLFSERDKRKKNFVSLALKLDHPESANLLLSSGDMNYFPPGSAIFRHTEDALSTIKKIREFYPDQFKRFLNEYMIEASDTGNIETLEFLLAEGADVRYENDRVLMATVRTHDAVLAKKLTELGATPNSEILDFAFKVKAIEVLEQLDEKGTYKKEIKSFKREFPDIGKVDFVGTWQGPSGWGFNTLIIRENATGIMIGGTVSAPCVFKMKDGALLGYPIRPSTGEFTEESSFSVHLISADQCELRMDQQHLKINRLKE